MTSNKTNDKQKLDCDGDGLFTGGRAENVREENSALFEGLASNRPLQGQIRPPAKPEVLISGSGLDRCSRIR